MTGLAALRGQPIDHSAQERKDRAFDAIDQAIAKPFGGGWSSAGWVHSDFLQVAANLGVVPALIFLAGYLFTLQKLFRNTRSCLRTGEHGDFALALLLAFIAAGEHLAQRWRLRVPAWTQRPEHFALERPVFHPESRALRGVLIVESPPAFRSRLIFTRAEPLDRARFPAGVARAQLALEWPKLDATAHSDQGRDN